MSKKPMPDTLIFIVAETLTDNSVVYNVKLGNLTWAATTEDDARELAEKIVDAIDDHTNSIADVIYE